MWELMVEMGEYIIEKFVMLVISQIIYLTNAMKYIWNILFFASILFNCDELLSSSFFYDSIQKNLLPFDY